MATPAIGPTAHELLLLSDTLHGLVHGPPPIVTDIRMVRTIRSARAFMQRVREGVATIPAEACRKILERSY